MSLIVTASPLDNEYEINNDIINRKKQSSYNNTKQNKTQKKRFFDTDTSTNQNQNQFKESSINNEKVNSVLASIHKGYYDDDEDNDTFKPILPQTQQNQRTQNLNNKKMNEGMTNYNNLVPQPIEQNEMDLQKLESNYMNDAEVEKYYKKLLPGYTELNNIKHHQNNTNDTSTKNQNNHFDNPIVDKLNYIINLLEEQQDQKTNNVTEEVILYSFLGVFIIFVVDGFTKVGKYVR